MIKSEIGTIISIEKKARGHVNVRITADAIARAALPGQFVNVRCIPMGFGTRTLDNYEHLAVNSPGDASRRSLLLRPFAIHESWTDGSNTGQIEVLAKVVGRGTRALAEMKPGDKVDLLGPLGNTIDLEWAAQLGTAVVVAGGVGIAPLMSVTRFLRKNNVDTLVIIGAMTEDDLPLDTTDTDAKHAFMESHPQVGITAGEVEKTGAKVLVVVMEGEKGHIGLPTDALDLFLHEHEKGAKGKTGIFTCGPWGMMREVARHAEEHDVRCQVMLEERMGCGIGVCMSCTCGIKSDDGTPVRKRICVDGPVFEATEVIWNEK